MHARPLGPEYVQSLPFYRSRCNHLQRRSAANICLHERKDVWFGRAVMSLITKALFWLRSCGNDMGSFLLPF